jgi:carbon monoxide dehydrogenase subunit G
MKLRNTFTVEAGVEETWNALLDIERVATCLPGATIEATDEHGVYRGTMRVKLGPVTTDYAGTARMQDVDDDTHTASIAVEAREKRGQGTAAAVIRNHLEPANGGTRVTAETDLRITGRQAQFGRGIMEDVAGTMMDEFAARLEQLLEAGRAPAGEAATDGGEPPAQPPAEALDVGSALARTASVRAALGAFALLVALAVGLRLLRRGH